jgi:hypothetical protein
VWTGNEAILWGGQNAGGLLNDGARYAPSANTWSSVSTAGAPVPRVLHTAVWTGIEMIIWGGANDFDNLNDTFTYTPGRLMYLYQRP